MRLYDNLMTWFWNSLVKGNDEKRMAKQTLPEGVTALVDIPYQEDGKQAHLLDVYFPEGAEGKKLPTIIDIHGGGLMYAYKELNKNYCYHLVKRGFAVISLSYSLAPADPYPACVVDVMNALEWIGKNIDAYPCDKDKLFITGDSAGGLLAANAVLISTSKELQDVYGVKKPDLTFKSAGFTSGMFFYDSGLAKFLAPCIFKGGIKKSEYKDYLAFCDIIDKGSFPPSYLVTSTEDMIHDATTGFVELLKDRQIEYVLDDFPKGGPNKLEHVFPVLYPSEYEESVTSIDHMTQFFLAHI